MYQSLKQTTFNVFKSLFLIEYGLVLMTKCFQNLNSINWDGKKMVYVLHPYGVHCLNLQKPVKN